MRLELENIEKSFGENHVLKKVSLMAEGGKVVVDEKNKIKRPVSPVSEGYSEFWDRLHNALYQEA